MSALADYILIKDREQSAEHTARARMPGLLPPSEARRCPRNPDHGALSVHGTGALLVCVVSTAKETGKKGDCCGYSEPLSR